MPWNFDGLVAGVVPEVAGSLRKKCHGESYGDVFSVKIERGIVCRKEYHVLEGSQFGETSMWGYPKKERATHDL